MKKRILTGVVAVITLMMCTVSVFATYVSGSIYTLFGDIALSLDADESAKTATATTGYNSHTTTSYAKAYINYSDGNYISAYNLEMHGTSATVVHTVYPSDGASISGYSSYHYVIVDGGKYGDSLYA